MLVNEVIEGAIKVLETDGWTKGHYYEEGAYCLVGALYKAAGHDWNPAITKVQPYSANAVLEAKEKIKSCMAQPILLTMWNDKWNRTKEEVIDILKCALEK